MWSALTCAVYLYSEIELPIRGSRCVDIRGSLHASHVIFNCSWCVVLFFPSSKSFVLPKRFLFYLARFLPRQHHKHHIVLGTQHKGECLRKLCFRPSVMCLALIHVGLVNPVSLLEYITVDRTFGFFGRLYVMPINKHFYQWMSRPLFSLSFLF